MDPRISALIEEYAPMANAIARSVYRKAPHQLDLQELVSLAHLGMVEAGDKWEDYCARNNFDPERHEYFRPYAQRRARGKIMDTLRKDDFVQRSVRTKAQRLVEAGMGQNVNERQLAETTGMTLEEVREVMHAAANAPVHLEDVDEHPAYEDMEETRHRTDLDNRIRVTHVRAIQKLEAPHQVVLALHYVLGLELREVAVLMEITESRASHLHTEAVLEVHRELEKLAVAVSEES